MKSHSKLLALCEGNPPITMFSFWNSIKLVLIKPSKGQQCGAFMCIALPLLLSLLSLPRASCWADNRYACDIWDANTHVTSLMISVSFNCISRMINLCDKLRYWLSKGATQFTLKSIFDLLRRYPYSIDPDLFRKLRELFSQDLVKSRNNDT